MQAQTKEAITVTDFGELYSTYEITADDERVIIEQTSAPELRKIKTAYTETQWPSSINTLDGRNANRDKMYKYSLYKVATLSSGAIIVCAPAAENIHMPEGLKPSKDLYFVVGASGFGAKQTPPESNDIPGLSSLYDEYVAPDYSSLTTFDQQISALITECDGDFVNIWGTELFDDPDAMEQYESAIIPEGANLATITADYEYNYIFWANYGEFDNQRSAKEAYDKLVAKIENSNPECCSLENLGETVTDTLTFTSWTVEYPSVYIEAQIGKIIDPADGKVYYPLFLGLNKYY